MRLRLPFLLAVALLAACGVKRPPIPPSALLIPPPGSLEAQVREGCLRLSWKAPSTEPAGYRVLRRRADEPEFKPLADLPLAERSFTDCEVPTGQSAAFQVQSLNAQGKAGLASPAVPVVFLPPPPAPASLTAEPGDGFVQLCWLSPPAVESPAGFRVYRALLGEPYPRRSADPQPAPGPCWVDGNLTNGKTYRYVVRTVLVAEGGIEEEGPASSEVEVIPEDKIPPLPPAELVAAPSAQGVVLHWKRNPEPDLKGYYVYRRLAGAARWERITPEPLREPEYLDTDRALVPGREYDYAVTALDHAPTLNESPKSEPARALTLPR
jgi:hypothetical protein